MFFRSLKKSSLRPAPPLPPPQRFLHNGDWHTFLRPLCFYDSSRFLLFAILPVNRRARFEPLQIFLIPIAGIRRDTNIKRRKNNSFALLPRLGTKQGREKKVFRSRVHGLRKLTKGARRDKVRDECVDPVAPFNVASIGCDAAEKRVLLARARAREERKTVLERKGEY